jgi:type IV secretion system protein VirB2
MNSRNCTMKPATMSASTTARRWDTLCVLLLAGALACAVPADTWATSTSGTAEFQKPFMTVVQSILDLFNSGLARMLAILAVIGLGLAAMAGKLSWIMATRVVVGIVLVFGASSIVGLITGKSGNTDYHSRAPVPVLQQAAAAVAAPGPRSS